MVKKLEPPEGDPNYDPSDPMSALGPAGRERLEERRGLNEMFVVLGLTGLIVLIAFAMFFFDW
jgi:hypothetical protein